MGKAGFLGFVLMRGASLALLLSSLPAAAGAGKKQKAPNILLLFPDQWRYDWAGFNPEAADLKVPTLKKLAAEGTRYTYAYTPAPWCVPSRACLASVKPYGNHRGSAPNVVNGHDFPLDIPTWYQSMQKAGYHIITVGKDDLTQSRLGTAPDGSRHAADLGFDAYYRSQDKFATFAFQQPWDQYGSTLAQEACPRNDSGQTDLRSCQKWCYGVPAASKTGECCHDVAGHGWNCPVRDQVGPKQELYIDDLMASQAEDLLDAVPEGKPWVLHLSFPGPHPPFIITEGMDEAMGDRSFPVSFDNDGVTHEEQRQIRRSYAAEIENLDSIFGRLLQKLKDREEADNTYVVVTSDHGEMLGDHNLFGKKVPWEASIRVPLIVHGPGVKQGSVVDTPVSTLSAIDFILSKAGAKKQDDWYQLPLPTSNDPKHARVVISGLTTDKEDFRVAIKKFNDTHVLKAICCPLGCPGGNSKVPSMAPDAQIMAFNILADPEEAINLNMTSEAFQMVHGFSEGYGVPCLEGTGLHFRRGSQSNATGLFSLCAHMLPRRGSCLAAVAAAAAAGAGLVVLLAAAVARRRLSWGTASVAAEEGVQLLAAPATGAARNEP